MNFRYWAEKKIQWMFEQTEGKVAWVKPHCGIFQVMYNYITGAEVVKLKKKNQQYSDTSCAPNDQLHISKVSSEYVHMPLSILSLVIFWIWQYNGYGVYKRSEKPGYSSPCWQRVSYIFRLPSGMGLMTNMVRFFCLFVFLHFFEQRDTSCPRKLFIL